MTTDTDLAGYPVHRPLAHHQLRLWVVGLLWVAALLLGLWALGWAPVAFR